MGMAVSLDLRGPGSSSQAIEEVVAWLHHIDRTFSTYISDSPISRIGRGEPPLSLLDHRAVDEAVAEEIDEVLRACETLRIDTGGAFDPYAVPAPNGTMFDPSGYVKGWAIERAAWILEGHGCENFCLNAGGDVALRGRPAPGEPWRVGVRHPSLGDSLAVVVEGEGSLAIATSATYERGAHIIDPATGEPTTDLASATVVGPDLAVADAYATALFVKGIDGLAWLADRPDYEGYVATHDDITHWTTGFARYRTRS